MFRRFAFLFIVAMPVLLSCSNEDDNNEDLTTTVNKNGSVETSVGVAPLDSTHHILTTKHKVWVRDTVYKTIEYRDTLPGLGTQLATAENSDGDQKGVLVKKEYEIYITIK